MPRVTWTFEPDKDVKRAMRTAINQKVGANGRKLGIRTAILNEAVRKHLTPILQKGVPKLEEETARQELATSR